MEPGPRTQCQPAAEKKPCVRTPRDAPARAQRLQDMASSVPTDVKSTLSFYLCLRPLRVLQPCLPVLSRLQFLPLPLVPSALRLAREFSICLPPANLDTLLCKGTSEYTSTESWDALELDCMPRVLLRNQWLHGWRCTSASNRSSCPYLGGMPSLMKPS